MKRAQPEDEKPKAPTPQPDPQAICAALLADYALRNNGRLPGIMPQAPRDAAAWWLAHQEPRHFTEKPRQVPVHGSDKRRWDDSYATRVTQNLRTFLAMPDEQRAYVISAIRAGIPWRGDSIAMFERIVAEAERMQEIGVEAYRKESRARAKKAMAKMAGI